MTLVPALLLGVLLAAQNRPDTLSHAAKMRGKDKHERPSKFLLTISQDNAFGFVPQVFASFPFKNSNLDYTFYANFWTNPAQANTSKSSDFWVESGFGIATRSANQKWYLNPAIGLSSGRMLSGSDRGLFAEGIVPSMTLRFNSKRVEGEVVLNYYKNIRGTGKNKGTDYLRWWISSGIGLTKFVTVGWIYENYRSTDNPVENIYSWLGAYMKVTIKNKYWLQFSTGINTESQEKFGPEFYRLGAGIPLAD